MKTVRDLLDEKGREAWSIAPDASVYDALRLMAEKKIGALVVTSGERVVGILSERDYARKVVLLDRASRDTRVDEIMSPDPVCISLERTVDHCLAMMTARRFRHLPVLEKDRLVGVISIGDAVKAKISDQEFLIRQLESYIAGH